MPSESGNLGVRNRPGRLVPGLSLVRSTVLVYTVNMARRFLIVFTNFVARKLLLVFICALARNFILVYNHRLARKATMVFMPVVARKSMLVFIIFTARIQLVVFIHSVALSVKRPLSAPIQNNKGVSVNFRHGPHAGHTTALSFPDRQGCVLPARNGLGTI